MFKLLIIDDTKSIHSFIKHLVADTEMAISSAFNGAEALEILKSGHPYDVVLLDWEMPVMDGPHTLAEIKKLGLNAPVVMMTTKNTTKDIVQMLNEGAAEYLMKPFTKDILLEKIAAVSEGKFNAA